MQHEVLILTPFFSPNIGGVETHLDDLVDVLKDLSFKSYVLTYQPLMSDKTAPAVETIGSVEIHRISWIRHLFYKLEPYPLLDFLYLTPRLLFATILFLIKHPTVRIIHAQGINAACIAILLKPVFKTKVIVSTHAVYEFQGNTLFAKITRWIFNQSDKILTLLNHSKRELIKLGVRENKIEPYTYWINQNIFTPSDKLQSKNKLNWDPQKFHVLFIGRLFEKKGVNELLQAAQLLQTNTIIQIHIIGTGPQEQQVKQAAVINPVIQFHGKVSNQDLPQYYQAADTFIIPSTHPEGAGRVIMESLSCGTPVIGSNRGGIPEILDSSVGILIEVTPQNIVNAIQQMQEKVHAQPQLSELCRIYAQKHFSVRNAKKIINAYII